MGLYCHNEKCYEKNGSVLLEEDDVDSRQEWTTVSFHCPECDTSFERRTDYKTQSDLIASDVLYMIDEKGNKIEVE